MKIKLGSLKKNSFISLFGLTINKDLINLYQYLIKNGYVELLILSLLKIAVVYKNMDPELYNNFIINFDNFDLFLSDETLSHGINKNIYQIFFDESCNFDYQTV